MVFSKRFHFWKKFIRPLGILEKKKKKNTMATRIRKTNPRVYKAMKKCS